MEGLAIHAGLAQNLKFESYDGGSKMRHFLANLKVSPEFTRGEYTKILVTRDADSSYEAAWQSVKDSIQHVFAHTVANPGDWVKLESGPKIAAWVIPGQDQNGMIETLCLDAARSKAPEMFTCLDPFVACLTTQWKEAPHEKIRFLLWTIIAKGPNVQDRLSMEYAIKNLDFNWENAAYDSLKALFKDLSA
jgi:hypothetical protein